MEALLKSMSGEQAAIPAGTSQNSHTCEVNLQMLRGLLELANCSSGRKRSQVLIRKY
jgi:hypothetical protein